MNRKGSLEVGGFIMLFVALVVGLNLIVPSAQNIGQVTDLNRVSNQTVTIPAALNTAIALSGKQATNVLVYNSTNLVTSGNYTVSNDVLSNGVLTSNIKFTVAGYNGTAVNLTYDSAPVTYSNDAGARTMSQLVIIFAALALVAAVIYSVYQNWEEVAG